MVLKIYTDGASKGNPGKAGAGIAISDTDSDVRGPIYELSYPLGVKTNNEAEYLAVVRGLEFMDEMGFKEADFYSDSQLLVKQINGEYKVKAPKVIPLFNQVKSLLIGKTCSFKWLRREENSKADELANIGVEKN